MNADLVISSLPERALMHALVNGTRLWGDPDAWNFETAADQVRAFCDAVGIAGPVVFGHSFGSFVAMV
jgi:pimeloyl-ACP methyl ester carboxylesterase